MSYNHFDELPPTLGNFISLKYLNFKGNNTQLICEGIFIENI